MVRMSEEYMGGYQRVLPRDAFNEGNLLTNIGRLWILLSEYPEHTARIEEEDVDFFNIQINDATGGLTVSNLTFTIGGVRHYLERPLNSREKWPLMVYEKDGDDDFESVEIFDEDGDFTSEMLELIEAKNYPDHKADEKDHKADLIARLETLANERKHEQGLSKADHPQAMQVSVAGENRVCRQIANLLPEILEALGKK